MLERVLQILLTTLERVLQILPTTQLNMLLRKAMKPLKRQQILLQLQAKLWVPLLSMLQSQELLQLPQHGNLGKMPLSQLLRS